MIKDVSHYMNDHHDEDEISKTFYINEISKMLVSNSRISAFITKHRDFFYLDQLIKIYMLVTYIKRPK